MSCSSPPRNHYLGITLKTTNIQLPITGTQLSKLRIGDKVFLTGELLTARDETHKKLMELINNSEPLPLNLSTTALFYCGPSPTPIGKVCGAIGPTTSSRMDTWTPLLLDFGLKVMIGKGERSQAVTQAIKQSGAVYLTCIGGAAAYLARHIVSCETFLWPELGAEAIFKLSVVNFPAYVAIV